MAKKTSLKRGLRKLWASQKALAIPVTYLLLFFSLILLISLTYSLAVAKISARGNTLKASIAKQNMLGVDDAVRSVAWSFGASKIVYVEDAGGSLQTSPTARNLIINLTDEHSFYDIVFNSSIGKTVYELEPSGYSFSNEFIVGDDRVIANESKFTMTQLYLATGLDGQELTLSYRPSATVAVIGTGDGKPLNLIRMYIITLNSSSVLALQESFYLRVTATNVTTIARHYDFNQTIFSLLVKVVLEGVSGGAKLPISSGTQGAYVDLEIVICNIKLQKTEA